MDIYEFFNSKDIAEYCRSIDHKFSAIETAYIVWYSDHHTLSEKHNAWQEIIDTLPDEKFHPHWDLENYTLHSFLREYMRLQNRYIEDFFQTQAGYVYVYDTTNTNVSTVFDNDTVYSNFEACFSALKKYEIGDDTYDTISIVTITRHKLYDSPISFCDATESESIVFNNKLEPIELEPRYDGTEETSLLCVGHGFYSMWVAIPVPFKKGDIVTVKHTREHVNGKCKPFILEVVPWWIRHNADNDINKNREYWLNFGVDWTDMNLGAWFQDRNGELYWDHQYCYLDLEYYRDDFKGAENFLVAVSNCMQEKISIIELLKSHSIVLMENYAEEMRKYFYHNIDALSNCGIEYKDVFNK